MAKYSYQLKKEVVNAYLNGEGGYKYLADLLGSHQSLVLFFVAYYCLLLTVFLFNN
jgi:transposase